jgi:hypothetical protein
MWGDEMIIFPLSIPGKIVLILIAIVLGLIWSMLQWPDFWKRKLGKSPDEPLFGKKKV